MGQSRGGAGSARAAKGRIREAAISLEAALSAVCNRLRRGIILVDSSRRLLFANEAARRALDSGDALAESGGQLLLRQEQPMSRLSAYLARPTRARRNGSSASMALRLERASGLSAYRLLVTRLDLAAADSPGPVFLCMVFEPHAAREVPRQVLIELYGLSPAEAAVASDLFAGRDVKALARTRGVSQSTIRTQLRSIFRKCDVASQAQLLQLLSLGPRVT